MVFSGDMEGLRELIREMEREFGLDSTEDKTKLYGRVKWRMEQLHNLPGADPPLNDEWKDAQKFQSDAPRRVYVGLMARGTENHFNVGIKGLRDTATERQRANKVETVINSGLYYTEERSNVDIQGGLMSGIIAQCYGILHWCKAEHLMPPVPEAEWLDDLPDDPDERKRYEEADAGAEAVSEAEEAIGKIDRAERRRQRKYREKNTAREERYKAERAQAGFPWWVETIDAMNFAFTEDRSLNNGMSRALVVRDMPISDYVDRLRGDRKDLRDARSLSEVTKGKVKEHGMRGAPQEWEPNSDTYGKRVRVWQLWTRDEFYEVVSPVLESGYTGEGIDASAFSCAKGFKHPYTMPPFAIAPFSPLPGNDPALKYRPMLEGMYNLKPIFDRAITLLSVAAEQNALPYMYWKNTETNEPWQDEQGNVIKFQLNSGGSHVAPPGYELVQVINPINEAWVKSVEFFKAQYEEAEPPSGLTEVGATSQPWMIRLDQQQQAVFVKMALKSITRAIATMARSMVKTHSLPADKGGFAGPLCVYKYERQGEVDYSEVVHAETEDFRSLNVYCNIDAISSAERITVVEHGVGLLKAGRPDANGQPTPIITDADFYENYLGKGDPDAYKAELDGQVMFEKHVKPGLEAQYVKSVYGSKIKLGTDGEFVGPDGAVLDPAGVLAANGLPPEVIMGLQQLLGMAPPVEPGMMDPAMAGGSPAGVPMPAPGGGATVMGNPMVPGVSATPNTFPMMGQTTGSLPPLPVPGTIPLGGMQG
jgi:hypothetical protein